MSLDRADWHYEDALEAYLNRNGLDEDAELSDDEEREVWLYACDHIGVFMKWLCDRGFLGEESDEDGVRSLKNGEISGSEYLLDYCDGKFWDCDVREDVLPFVEDYYTGKDNTVPYLADYFSLLPEETQVYSTITDKDFYAELKPLIDEAYSRFGSR